MSLRVLTLNVWALAPPLSRDNGARMRAIGAALGDLELDVAALQEVWHEDSRTELLAASKQSGLEHVWQPPGGMRGSGLLVMSRWPIRRASLHRFELRGIAERLHEADYLGGKGYAVLELDTGDGPVALIDTHLQAAYAARACDPHVALRVGQAVQLATSLRAISLPFILAGDLNFEEQHEEYAVLTALTGVRDAAAALDRRQDTVLPANFYLGGTGEARRIDFLFSRGGRSRTLSPVSIERVLHEAPVSEGCAPAYSDHSGLLGEFEIGQGADDAPVDPGAIRAARELLVAGQREVETRWQRQRVLGSLALATLPAAFLAAGRPALSRRRLLAVSLRSLGVLGGSFGALRLGLCEAFRPAEVRGFEAALRRLDSLEPATEGLPR